MTHPKPSARRVVPLLAGVALAGVLAGCNSPGVGGFQDAMGRQAGEAMGQQLFGGGNGDGGDARAGDGNDAGGGAAAGWGAAGDDVEDGEIYVYRPQSGTTIVTSYPYDVDETGSDWFVQAMLGDGRQGQQHLFVQVPRSRETAIAQVTLTSGEGSDTLTVPHSEAAACDSSEDCQYLARAVTRVTEAQLRALTADGGTLEVSFDNGDPATIAIGADEVQAFLDKLEAERQDTMGGA